jgi:hypothetical protein
MEQIIIQVKDKEKAKLLLDLLTALDFVDSVSASSPTETEIQTVTPQPVDFFALAGLWAGREITLTSIRQKAWPRQQ